MEFKTAAEVVAFVQKVDTFIKNTWSRDGRLPKGELLSKIPFVHLCMLDGDLDNQVISLCEISYHFTTVVIKAENTGIRLEKIGGALIADLFCWPDGKWGWVQ